jgi:hypothetical protein
LSDEEVLDMFADPTSFVPYEEPLENLNPYENQINDWRKVTELEPEFRRAAADQQLRCYGSTADGGLREC